MVLRPVGWGDLADIQALKADPLVFAMMLGGVRTPSIVVDELAADVSFWARTGVGMWTCRDRTGGFVGLTGLMERPDGRGIALRFAIGRRFQGRGLAREAAGAALRFGHDVAGLPRIIAVARESNFGSRTVLGGIGMIECGSFVQGGYDMLVYESRRRTDAVSR
jgi:RimJ/RimL family protein N-acetyltransferase